MGNTSSINSINFEDMQAIIKKSDYIIINTLDINEQKCLIKNTVSPSQEIKILNDNLKNTKLLKIIIYGKNCNDTKLLQKYKQLINLGYVNSAIYIGGLFEWLLLQEIYGEDEFPTTSYELNHLLYKPDKTLP